LIVDRKGRRGTSEAGLPLRAFTCSTTELRTCVREESNLRPCDHEVTALFTTGMGDTIREQAIAETPARRSPCGPGSALSAELPAHGTPGGIRTRDLSFGDEVSAIFTTDRELVGGERATLLPLRRAMTELWHFCRRDLNHATSDRKSGRRSCPK